MMFTLREFIKSGMMKAVGKMADYQIILNSAGWFEKGVLTEDDLSEIHAEIEARYVMAEESEVIPETEAGDEEC